MELVPKEAGSRQLCPRAKSKAIHQEVPQLNNNINYNNSNNNKYNNKILFPESLLWGI